MPLSDLEKNILRTKGLGDRELSKLGEVGVNAKADFSVVGDAATLASLIGVPVDTAQQVMAWAVGAPAPTTAPTTVVVDGGDIVSCVHCKARQPKDYSSGDLCPSCGKQAEPILACFWCGHSGPGKYCRSCGAEFVPTGELELAVLLKRDGLPKDEVPQRLRSLSTSDKDALWGRVRRPR